MIDGWRPHDLAKFPLCRRTKVHIKIGSLFFAQKLRKLQTLFEVTSSLKVSFPRCIGCEKINPNKTNQWAVFWHLEWFLCTYTMMEVKVWSWLMVMVTNSNIFYKNNVNQFNISFFNLNGYPHRDFYPNNEYYLI